MKKKDKLKGSTLALEEDWKEIKDRFQRKNTRINSHQLNEICACTICWKKTASALACLLKLGYEL